MASRAATIALACLATLTLTSCATSTQTDADTSSVDPRIMEGSPPPVIAPTATSASPEGGQAQISLPQSTKIVGEKWLDIVDLDGKGSGNEAGLEFSLDDIQTNSDEAELHCGKNSDGQLVAMFTLESAPGSAAYVVQPKEGSGAGDTWVYSGTHKRAFQLPKGGPQVTWTPAGELRLGQEVLIREGAEPVFLGFGTATCEKPEG